MCDVRLVMLSYSSNPHLHINILPWNSLCVLVILTLYNATHDGISEESKGLNNIALASLLQLGDPKACVDLLIKTDRVPEAALFARTYAPRQVFNLELPLGCSSLALQWFSPLSSFVATGGMHARPSMPLGQRTVLQIPVPSPWYIGHGHGT